VAKIWTDSDPWLTKRLEHDELISRGNLAITNAVMTAMDRWLEAARLAIYHRPQRTAVLTPPPVVTADAGNAGGGGAAAGAGGTGSASESQGIPAGMLPDLSMWPAASSWTVMLDQIVMSEVTKLFGEAFIKATKEADIQAAHYAQAYISIVSDRLSENLWSDGVFAEVREVIAEGMAKGLSITHITEELGSVLDPGHYEWQARRIARTETMGAVNSGTWNGASAYSDITGERMYKQWYATKDTRTRPDHVEAHKQVVPIETDFVVGGYMMAHPGAEGGPAREVCNCRCTILVLDESEADPYIAAGAWDDPDEPSDDVEHAEATGLTPAEQQNLTRAGASTTQVVTTPSNDLETTAVTGASTTFATDTQTLPTIAPGSTPPVDMPAGDGDGTGVGYWWGILAPMDAPSADGRMIAMPTYDAGGDDNTDARGNPLPRTRPMPLPLLYQDALAPSHDGAVAVGLIRQVWIDNGCLYGCGEFDLEDPRAAEIARKVAAGHLGWISVDLDDTDMEYREGISVGDAGIPEYSGVSVAADWRLMSATLVSQPAFPTAKITTGRPTGDGAEDDHGAPALLDNDELNAGQGADASGRYGLCEDPACGYCAEVIAAAGSCASPDCTFCSTAARLGKSEGPVFGHQWAAFRPLATGTHSGAPVFVSPPMPNEAKHNPHRGAKGPSSPNRKRSTPPVPVAAALVGGPGFKVLHPDTGLPVAPAGTAWDGAAAAKRIAEWATNADGDLDPAKYSRAFLYRDDDAKDDSKTAYKLGYADLIDGRLTIVPKGVYAVAGAIAGARTPLDVPSGQQDDLKSATERLYGRLASALDDDSITPPWKDDSKTSKSATRTAVSFTTGRPEFAPPLAWFQNPSFPSYMNVTICDDGRIFGHLAPWDACHTGFPNECITAPRSSSGYAYFHQGTVRTAEGSDVAVGTIHLGTDHARGRLGAHDAQRHYADTGMAAAVVRAGEDAFGIWISGAVLPGADLVTLRRAPWSGDWRRIGAAMELCGVLAVNQPGFPVPRPAWKTDDRGVVCSLTAAAGTTHAKPDVPGGTTVVEQFSEGVGEIVARRVLDQIAADRARERRFAAAKTRAEAAGRQYRAERFARAMESIRKGA